MIAPNIIIGFDGAHASIPTGYERDTRFDARIPKCVTSAWGDTAGAATHTHTFTHSHTIASHRHTVSVSGRINGNTYGMGVSGGCVEQNHGHYGIGYTGYSNAEACQSTVATTAAASNIPPIYDVIFIKSVGFNGIPVNGIVYAAGNRPGLTYHTASEGRFLRGAATATDAGNTTGGASSHAHTQSHTHTETNHTQGTGYAGREDGRGEDGMSSPALAHGNEENQQHAFSSNAAAQPMLTDTTNTSTDSVEPYAKALKAYYASVLTLPQPGDIAMTTDATNPVGWITCDGTDGTPDLQNFYIKNTQSIGGITGANTHGHTLTHGHTGNGTHVHTLNTPMAYSGDQGGHNGSGREGVTSHQHNVSNCQAVTANYTSNTTTSSTENNEPPYIKVRYIQLKYTLAAGAMFGIL